MAGTRKAVQIGTRQAEEAVAKARPLPTVYIASESNNLNVNDILLVIYRVDDSDVSHSQSIAARQLSPQPFDVVVFERILGQFGECKVKPSGYDGVSFLVKSGSLPGELYFIHSV